MTRKKQNTPKSLRTKSTNHQSTTVTTWFENATQIILQQIRLMNQNKPFTKEQLLESAQKMKLLSTSSDTEGIAFTGLALHFQYYADKLYKRGFLLYSIFEYCFKKKLYPVADVMLNKSNLFVVSIGGGPGTDICGCKLLLENYLKQIKKLKCCLFDKEKSWKRYIPTLQSLLQPIELSFERCDVTKSLTKSDVNKKLHKCCRKVDLFIFSYVCHETSKLSGDGHFYKELAQNAKLGSLFLFTDVIGHSMPAFCRIEKWMKMSLEKSGHELLRMDIEMRTAQVMFLYKQPATQKD